MRIWKSIPGVGLIDLTKVTAVKRHDVNTYFNKYEVHCGGQVIYLEEKRISRNDFLKMLPGITLGSDVKWED